MNAVSLSGRGHVVATIAALAIFVTVGCDTVAEISFVQRDFQDFNSTGVLNASDCTATDTELMFRFVPFDADHDLIAPNQTVNGARVDLTGEGRNFGAEDIDFFSSVLYPAPDVECTADADCSGVGADFRCVLINPFNANARNVCGMDVEIQAFQGDVVFVPGQDVQSIGVLMAHGSSLEGVDEDGLFAPERSTDRSDHRISAARTFVAGFRRSSFADDSRMCVVSFGGEGAAAVVFYPTPTSCLSGAYDNADANLAGLGVNETGDRPIWSAIVESVNQSLGSSPGDRAILVFTDGLDTGSIIETYNDALAAVVGNNTQVHFVHLDNPPNDAEGNKPYTGPDDDFAQMACATNGSYQYAQAPQSLRTLYQNLSVSVASHYEVRTQIASMVNVDPGSYRVATGVRVTLAGTERTLQLAGDKTDPATNQIIDDRMVVFHRPVPARPVDNGDDDGTGDGTEQ